MQTGYEEEKKHTKEKKHRTNIQVGHRIKLARVEKGLSQKDLAELVEMDPKYLSRIENGHSGISNNLLMKIGNILGKGFDYFFMDNPELKINHALDADIIHILEDYTDAQKHFLIQLMQIIKVTPIKEV